MSETMNRPAELVGLVDRIHFLDARLVAAGVEVRTAQADAEAANRIAEEAFVSGNTETMGKADAAADTASATLAKARRNAAALQRAREALNPEVEAAVEAGRMALRLAADDLIRAAEARYKTHAAKAAAALAEAVSIGFATGHPGAGILAMLTIPSSFMPGDAPLMAVQPGQEAPSLPKAAAPLVEAASMLRDAERLLIPVEAL